MIIARQQASLSDFVPHLPQRQLRQLRSQTIGAMQYGLMALAMFSVSALSGVVAGIIVGVFG
jgi:hypothetical protein